MKLLYYRHPKAPNFGDELNPWLWPRLLGNVLDEDESDLFIGIGSVLWNDYPRHARKYVMGAGYGAYTPPPAIDETWKFSFVRGPQTAEALGLHPSTAITDGAILLRAVYDCGPKPKRFRASYIPHWESLYTGDWKRVCRWAGINLIDPRNPVEQVLDEIAASEVVVAEAMHGAIVADNLRVPWIPVRPLTTIHRFKWTDWTRSLGLEYTPYNIVPSSWVEMEPALSRLRQRWGLPGRGVPTKRVSGPKPRRLIDGSLCAAAASRLRWLSTREPVLSRDTVIADLSARALEKVHAFQRNHGRVSV